MRVLIIEDEPHAAQRLRTLMNELAPDAVLDGPLDTVSGAVQWFKTHAMPDLLLADIQLADGLSFQLFEQLPISAPVIFTTAYDAYALKAFKLNSIDYILKPVDREELNNALKKVRRAGPVPPHDQLLKNISDAMTMITRRFKSRFVIKVGEHLRTIEVKTVRYFYSQEKATFCVTDDGRNLVLDYTLEQLEELVDPSQFFRINRKYFVSSAAIQDIISYSNSRLKLVLKGCADADIIVARERVQEFKGWLDR